MINPNLTDLNQTLIIFVKCAIMRLIFKRWLPVAFVPPLVRLIFPIKANRKAGGSD